MVRLTVLALVVVASFVNTSVQGGVIKPIGLQKLQADTPSARRVPTADGLLHFYVLPSAGGDSQVIQCPNGDLSIVDLGTSGQASDGYWHTNEITGFLQGQFHLIKTVLLTHNHADHYVFLPTVLTSSQDLSGLANIHLSCTRGDLPLTINDWITSIQADDKVRLFNNGRACGPNGIPCEELDLCPGDPSVQVKVMAANLANCDIAFNRNIDSVIFKITHNEVTVMFTGDFNDYTSAQDEDGPQKSMVDFYGEELKVTVYKMAHHGAQEVASKVITCNAHSPKAIFASGNPFNNNRFPRCDIFERFIQEVQSLCKPLETNPASEFYCGEYPIDNVVPDDKVQRFYTCGENSTNSQRLVTNNEYAIYTTIPDSNTLNVLEFTSDGVKWGFTNNFLPKSL